MEVMQSSSDLARDRTQRLFRFLSEFTQLRSKPQRTLSDDDEVVWLADIPNISEIQNYWGSSSDSETWLSVQIPKRIEGKPIPKSLQVLLRRQAVIQRNKLPKAVALEAPLSHGTGFGFNTVHDFQRINIWGNQRTARQNAKKVFDVLYSIYQKQQRLGETYEVVLGLGYLTWQAANARVARHLLTIPAAMGFDAAQGNVTVGVNLDIVKVQLEQDMLEMNQRISGNAQREIETQLAEILGDWQHSNIEIVLQSWIHLQGSQAVFDKTLKRQEVIGNTPRIHLAPAIILRKRPLRDLTQMLDFIAQQSADIPETPLSVRRIVEVIDDNNSLGVEGIPEQIYFPLPANSEQLEIIEKLRSRQGVLVQGPPGTGKSHTIVNLVSHLLATGHRILVTSHTARALRVLRDKFPKEIEALCVLNLGDGSHARNDLETSVAGITQRYNQRKIKQDAETLQKLELNLDQLYRCEALILRDLQDFRERETKQFQPSEGYSGTAQMIASRIKNAESEHIWLQSYWHSDLEKPPILNAEALLLLDDLHNSEFNVVLPFNKYRAMSLSNLPDKEIIFKALQQFDKAQENLSISREKLEKFQRTLQSIWRNLTIKQLEDIQNALDKWLYTHKNTFSNTFEWSKQALTQIFANQEQLWIGLQKATQPITTLESDIVWSSELQITGLNGLEHEIVIADAQQFLSYLDNHSAFPMVLLRPPWMRKAWYITEIRVNGKYCKTREVLYDLICTLEVNKKLSRIELEWSLFVKPLDGTLRQRYTMLLTWYKNLDQILGLWQCLQDVKIIVANVPQIIIADWQDIKDIQQRKYQITSEIEQRRMQDQTREELQNEQIRLSDAFSLAQNHFQFLMGQLQKEARLEAAHPLIQRLVESVEQNNPNKYRDYYQNLQAFIVRKKKYFEFQERLKLLQQIPQLIKTLQQADAVSLELWQKRLGDFESAWHWCTAQEWFEQFTSQSRDKQQRDNLEQCRNEIRTTLLKIAELKAWTACLDRMTETQRQKLIEWKQATIKVGKGTGKYAGQHRNTARKAMQSAQGAIPAWIMPLYRVAESFQLAPDLFDVVIIDEASQSGPEALFLNYIAKKIIVVGDDKQIKPDNVGLNHADVEALREQHIDDLPISKTIGSADSSYFEIAEVLFGGRIRLLEHFRCMPEIIQFSNNLCYRDNPLIPLKQFGANRLNPVVGTHFVKDGYNKGLSGNVINLPEIDALIQKILECNQDPQYLGKTFGVISLLGEAQARLIEQHLREHLSIDDIEKRLIVCGDAYAFQGDERDVMFISMVKAPEDGKRLMAQTDAKAERRYNVAASRAKEQMWLFHSVELHELKPDCLRHKFLSYCQNPRVEAISIVGISIAELEEKIRDPHKNEEAPKPFDSWFEVAVFLEIARRGYRVMPQFEVSGYRIDLIVEGLNGRLAVECDGDRWHGAEQYASDMARQRDLERAGFQFWRVRGSTYYRDPTAALEDLWATLDRAGIKPQVCNFDEDSQKLESIT